MTRRTGRIRTLTDGAIQGRQFVQIMRGVEVAAAACDEYRNVHVETAVGLGTILNPDRRASHDENRPRLPETASPAG
jgi:hypothetical protein